MQNSQKRKSHRIANSLLKEKKQKTENKHINK